MPIPRGALQLVNIESIKKGITSALNTLYEKDKSLIEMHAHEQTIVSNLACLLKPHFSKWDVDVEYNRKNNKPEPKKDENGRNRKIDIVIHKRGHDNENLSAILVKCEWNRELPVGK